MATLSEAIAREENIATLALRFAEDHGWVRVQDLENIQTEVNASKVLIKITDLDLLYGVNPYYLTKKGREFLRNIDELQDLSVYSTRK
jgi:hypothetical protein